MVVLTFPVLLAAAVVSSSAVHSKVTTSFSEGSYVAGSDIAPGRYTSKGAVEGIFTICSVYVYNDSNNVIDFDLEASKNAEVSVNVKEGQRVATRNCQRFVKNK